MKQVFVIVGLLSALTGVGTIGYRLTTGQSWLDSAYLAVVTLATVGSRDSGPSGAAMIFTIVYLLGGLSIFTYSAFQLGQIVVSVQLQKVLERRRMERDIRKLSSHFIVCGLGRMGVAICEFLAKRHKPFVVIEKNPERVASACQERHWHVIEGDATDDRTLLSAGIQQARGLATVLPTDADNVYVVLSARMLSSAVEIVARASEENAVQKLQRAGATRVISPFTSGAVKMARIMLSPGLEDVLEITDRSGHELEFADVQIDETCTYLGRELANTDLRERGVMILGIRRANGEYLVPPPGNAILELGDSLFAFGNSEAINALIGDVNRHP